ncbi:MAG: LysE/ArgO family amino acid transporter [Leptothrix sp. (in: b-proteobacteria)]
MDIAIYGAGFVAGLGLIIAIGAQNLFVLREALRGGAVGLVVGVSAVSDAALIAIGTGGIGWIEQQLPAVVPALTLGGALFLATHGVQAARRAWRPAAATVAIESPATASSRSNRSVLWLTLGFSWLNPHAWLDTTVLIGSLAQSQTQAHGAGANWVFAAGAASASAVWFSTLAGAAVWMAPWFRRPAVWRALDATVALILCGLAVSLLR